MQATWGKSISYGSISERNSEVEKKQATSQKNKPCQAPSSSDRERKKEREESFNKMIDPKAVRLCYWQYASLFWEHRCWSNIFGPWSNLIC